MSQVTSQSVPNESHTAFRSDMNAIFAAIFSNNCAVTEPATKVANMFWYDTGNSLLKRRDPTNASWITMADLNAVATSLTVSPTATGSQKPAKVLAASIANGNTITMLVGKADSANNSFAITFCKETVTTDSYAEIALHTGTSFKMYQDGRFKLSSLAGSGSRNVVADANGFITAP